jgi:nucleoside-diphosphate-sugar epimerase
MQKIENKTILVTGANGFIGRALCVHLTDLGFNVRQVVNRHGVDNDHSAQFVKMINSSTIWTDVIENVDIVIHLAAIAHKAASWSTESMAEYLEVNAEGTINLAICAKQAGVKRFIYLSSVGVNGNRSKKPFTELDTPAPKDQYSISKLIAETNLIDFGKQASFEFVIIRPPLVYGEGVKANFRKLLELANSKMPLPFGAIKNRRSLVYLGNLIDFITLCISHPKAVNETFFVSDDNDVSTTQIIASIVEVSCRKSCLIPIPNMLLVLGLTLCGKKAIATKLCGNLQVDITKAKTLLGWQPPYTFKQGIADSIQSEHQV